MIDATLAPLQARLLAPLAHALARRGVGADAITLAGFALGIAGAAAAAAGAFGVALGLILLNRLADGLDGAVARIAGPTDRGAFLDIALDFVFYAAVPLGFAFHDPGANALAAAALLAGFIGTGSSFLAHATLSARRGLPPRRAGKGISYLGGLTEGAETIALFVAICLWPGAST
ncbi:MAG: CDP-alcohol phosphatidyltransferase family protein, partial [Gemmobacter sp.]